MHEVVALEGGVGAVAVEERAVGAEPERGERGVGAGVGAVGEAGAGGRAVVRELSGEGALAVGAGVAVGVGEADGELDAHVGGGVHPRVEHREVVHAGEDGEVVEVGADGPVADPGRPLGDGVAEVARVEVHGALPGLGGEADVGHAVVGAALDVTAVGEVARARMGGGGVGAVAEEELDRVEDAAVRRLAADLEAEGLRAAAGEVGGKLERSVGRNVARGEDIGGLVRRDAPADGALAARGDAEAQRLARREDAAIRRGNAEAGPKGRGLCPRTPGCWRWRAERLVAEGAAGDAGAVGAGERPVDPVDAVGPGGDVEADARAGRPVEGAVDAAHGVALEVVGDGGDKAVAPLFAAGGVGVEERLGERDASRDGADGAEAHDALDGRFGRDGGRRLVGLRGGAHDVEPEAEELQRAVGTAVARCAGDGAEPVRSGAGLAGEPVPRAPERPAAAPGEERRGGVGEEVEDLASGVAHDGPQLDGGGDVTVVEDEARRLEFEAVEIGGGDGLAEEEVHILAEAHEAAVEDRGVGREGVAEERGAVGRGVEPDAFGHRPPRGVERHGGGGKRGGEEEGEKWAHYGALPFAKNKQ